LGLEDNFPYIELPGGVAETVPISPGVYANFGTGGVLSSYNTSVYIQDYIKGLTLTRNSGTSLELSEGITARVDANDYIDQGGPSLSGPWTASSLIYVYGRLVGFVGEFTAQTVAPDTPYVNYARYRSGGTDPDRAYRYLGAFRTDASGNAYNFIVEGIGSSLFVSYLENINASPFLVLNAGAATTETTVSCAGVVPPTARMAKLRVQATTVGAVLGNSEDGITLAGSVYLQRVSAGAPIEINMPLDSSRALTYMLLGAGTLDVQVMGYIDRR
jgi:hypothetical protein